MYPEDQQEQIARYEQRLSEYGCSAQALGWGQYGRQEVRFHVLAAEVLKSPECTVLDIGCGFADLYDFLRANGWRGQYTGIDIVPGLLHVARERHPGLPLYEMDITGESISLTQHDFVIACGVFNLKLKLGENATYIMHALEVMYNLAQCAVCVDFLSLYVDFQKPDAWHTDPGWALKVAKRLSKRVQLRHDYMPYEFALLIFRDDTISERNVFKAFEDKLRDHR